MPRIIIKKPRKGFLHPASKADIIEVLEFFGEECFYGLKSIKLVQGVDSLRKGNMMLARLEVPGSIIVYELPESPWVFNGIVAAEELLPLQHAVQKSKFWLVVCRLESIGRLMI